MKAGHNDDEAQSAAADHGAQSTPERGALGLVAGYKAGIYSDYAKDVIRPSAQECAQNGRARSPPMMSAADWAATAASWDS